MSMWENNPIIPGNSLEQFKAALRGLAFREVNFVIKERKQVVALISSDGEIVTRDNPVGFSSVAATLSLSDWASGRAEYAYYFGKTVDDVFFCKRTRGSRRVYFTPAFPKEHRFGLPLPHEVIVGVIVPSDTGGWRYEWWDCATKADQRFVEIILGKTTFSTREKMETKLTVEGNNLLFHLIMALHFSDVDYFVDLAKRGQPIDEGWQRFSVNEWLNIRLNAIVPKFCREVLGKIGL